VDARILNKLAVLFVFRANMPDNDIQMGYGFGILGKAASRGR
jgi:hypothetical protein